jgi:protein-disulfide isomerase
MPSGMCRSARNLSSIALVLLAVCSQHATSASRIAAHINDEEIPTADVDAASIKEVQRIRGRLTETARQALQDLIDQRLGIDDMPARERSQQREKIYRSHNVKLALPQPEALESALPPDQVVAVIGEDPIRASELERAAALPLYRLRGELYLQRRRDLDRLIDQRLLQLEAQRRGVTLEALERSFSEVEPVTDAEIQNFVARERAAGRTVEDPERVRPYLAFQKRYQRRTSVLEEIRAATQVRIDLRPPTRPRLPVDDRDGVAFGSTHGPVLVAYTNYSCAHCRTTHAELDRLLAAEHPPRIVLRDFVQDPVALQAAALVRCAAGNAHAAQMRRHLLQRKPPGTGETWFSEKELESVARIADMKASALRACIDGPEVRSRIEQDTKSALRLGFEKPPAFVAAGVPLSGMQTAEQLAAALSGKAEPALSDK